MYTLPMVAAAVSPYAVIGTRSWAPVALEQGNFTAPSFTAITSALNISAADVLTVLASGIGICLALCFAWWGARKLSRIDCVIMCA